MSGRASGPWNMALDEALLIDAAESGIGTLRFYEWSEPTLSLGYFQRYDDRHQHAASRDCACVRRQTGGGAILHDRELTYSITLPPTHPYSRKSDRLYRIAHDAFIAVLSQPPNNTGPNIGLHRVEEVSNAAIDESAFLCFQRRTPGDVVALAQNRGADVEDTIRAQAPNCKILGSAQRRSHGALLQHGSLLLSKSQAAPELPGYIDVAGQEISETLTDQVVRRLEKALSLQFIPSPIPQHLELIARELANNKYGAESWTKRR